MYKQFPKPIVFSIQEYMDKKETIDRIDSETAYYYNGMILNYDSLSQKKKKYIDDYYKLNPLFDNYNFIGSFGSFDPEKVSDHLITFYDDYFYDVGRRSLFYKVFKPIFDPLKKMNQTVYNTDAYCGQLLNREILRFNDSSYENYVHTLNFLGNKNVKIKNLRRYIKTNLKLTKEIRETEPPNMPEHFLNLLTH